MPVELWAARLDRRLSEGETAALLPLLPPERRARLLRMKAEEKRREPLCAYALLLMALREKLGWRMLPPICRGPQGKPSFAGHPEVCFNLSHTDGAVLLGLSDMPLGVDIERLRPMRPAAMRRLCGVCAEETFFPAWVRREALVKLSGGAVGRGDPPQPSADVHVFPLTTFPGYAAAVALRGGREPGDVRLCDLNELLGKAR